MALIRGTINNLPEFSLGTPLFSRTRTMVPAGPALKFGTLRHGSRKRVVTEPTEASELPVDVNQIRAQKLIHSFRTRRKKDTPKENGTDESFLSFSPHLKRPAYEVCKPLFILSSSSSKPRYTGGAR